MIAWTLVRQTWRKWRDDQATRQGAALAFYALFAAAPLLLVATAAAGSLFGADDGATWLHREMTLLTTPEVADTVRLLVADASEHTKTATIAGLLGTFYAGSRGFLHLQATLNNLWGVRQIRGPGFVQIVQKKLWAFAGVFLCGGLILASLLGTLMAQVVAHQLNGGAGSTMWGNEAGTLVLTTFLLAVVFKTLPDVVIAWRDVWVGAAVSALLFAVGKHGIALYIGHVSVSSSFGAAGSVVMLLLYVYYSAQVLLIGAEFTWVFAENLGTPITPNGRSARVVRETIRDR